MQKLQWCKIMYSVYVHERSMIIIIYIADPKIGGVVLNVRVMLYHGLHRG